MTDPPCLENAYGQHRDTVLSKRRIYRLWRKTYYAQCVYCKRKRRIPWGNKK